MVESQYSLAVLIVIPNLNICIRGKNVILSEYHILFMKTERGGGRRGREDRKTRKRRQSHL